MQRSHLCLSRMAHVLVGLKHVTTSALDTLPGSPIPKAETKATTVPSRQAIFPCSGPGLSDRWNIWMRGWHRSDSSSFWHPWGTWLLSNPAPLQSQCWGCYGKGILPPCPSACNCSISQPRDTDIQNNFLFMEVLKVWQGGRKCVSNSSSGTCTDA